VPRLIGHVDKGIDLLDMGQGNGDLEYTCWFPLGLARIPTLRSRTSVTAIRLPRSDWSSRCWSRYGVR